MVLKQKVYQIVRIPALILFYLGIWQLLSILVGSSLLLPSPIESAVSLWKIMCDPLCLRDLGYTFLRLVAGYLIGAVFGILLAILTANVPFFHYVFSPFRLLIKSTPVMSFVLLLLVSVVSNLVPVLVSAIMVAPMLWATTEQAILSLDPKLSEMGRLYFPFPKRVRTVYLPQMLPQILASAVTALGFAWKSVITAEVLSLPRFAIGNRMYLSKLYLETSDMVAWTILVVSLSLAMELLLKAVLKRKEAAK
ncbi:MAG: ABC transporter permease subunit [Clostridia bacterium]|nr:ABC transporter permease subunit [Clostridia bacterium]